MIVSLYYIHVVLLEGVVIDATLPEQGAIEYVAEAYARGAALVTVKRIPPMESFDEAMGKLEALADQYERY